MPTVFAVCLLAVIVGVRPVQAGDTVDFPLHRYQPSDFRRHGLSLSPRFNTRSSQTRESRGQNSNDYGQMSQSAVIHHYHAIQSRPYVANGNADLQFDLHDNVGDGENDQAIAGGNSRSISRSGSQSLSINAFANQEGRWYPRAGRWFTGYRLRPGYSNTPFMDWEGRSRHQETTGDTVRFSMSDGDSRAHNHAVDGYARLSVGIGRMDDVSFPAVMWFLLDRLRASGVDVRLNAAEMARMEAFLEERRKQRPFFDGRAAYIHDLESVEMFLREKAGDTPFTTRAILEMEDEYRYGHWSRRKSGWTAEVFPYVDLRWAEWESRESVRQADVRFHKDSLPGDLMKMDASRIPGMTQTRRDFSRHDGATRYGAGMRVEFARPLHRRWQTGATAELRGGRTDREYGENTGFTSGHVEYSRPFLDAEVAATLEWLPSTRSTFTLKGGFTPAWTFDYLGARKDLRTWFGRDPRHSSYRHFASLMASMHRALSHRLSFHVGGGLSHYRSKSRDEIVDVLSETQPPRDTRQFSISMDGGLTYHLF